jgi:RTX calcium-binding nonapeptide repeat (4 copies)
MPREGEGAVVRQGQLIALVVAFLIGCAVVLIAGASGVQAETSKKEEARCEGTRTIKLASLGGEIVTTNDIPGCPKGGLLLGTEGSDQTRSRDPARPTLSGGDGDDVIRGLGGNDEIFNGWGDDVVYAGPGNDNVSPESGDDVIYGGPGNDRLSGYKVYGGLGNDTLGGYKLYGGPGNDNLSGNKLYCGKGKDTYRQGPLQRANKHAYVDSSCEKKRAPKKITCRGCIEGPVTSSASASPVPVPPSGGAAILAPAAALLLGSGILTYVILRRR